MSDILNAALAAAQPVLKDEMQTLADNYLGGLKETLSGANEHVKPLVAAHLKKAAEYKWEAFNATDPTTRDQYAQGFADEMAIAKTVLISEATAVTEEQAETFAAGFDAVLSAVGDAAKAVLGAVVQAAIKGAVSGVVGDAGGDGGLDLSSVFPGI